MKQSLLVQHNNYISNIKDRGVKVISFKAPCCGQEIETRAAARDESWDTLAICPHCEKHFWKVTEGSKCTGTIPDFIAEMDAA